MTNRLKDESSPYLLQHAENPVDWFPWGEEALEKARAENRPILLSIGYSSCHWCHVMERESFEDPATARLMNELFVNIKVDREERPDLDQIYMKAVQAITGGGGWPMTVFLTPECVPYFGGTYYPPEPRHGMPSFSQVLSAAANAWQERPDEVEQGGERLLEALRRTQATPLDDSKAGEAELDTVHQALRARYDPSHGGFGRAPKFPQPPTLEVLTRQHLRTGEPEALEMLLHTLRRMAAGGMRDHLGGGFHRYSVDARWLVPHFEKMLYDNALLARTYTDAYRLTGSDDLAETAVSTLEYVLEDLTDASGAFYSARDADSEGEEGTFYVWSREEVDEVVGAEAAELFRRAYDVTLEGNFEGANILHLPHPIEAVAASEGVSVLELEGMLAKGRAALLERRAGREAPFRDEKALVSWNSMTLRALAEAGAVFDRPDFVEAARKNAEFISERMIADGRLLHTHLAGISKIPAFLEDHGALCVALITLNGVTLEDRWLDIARWLAEEIMARFWDEDAGTVYDTAHDAEALILRPRDPMDNATPSGPSLAAEALTLLGHLDCETTYEEAAARILDHEVEALRQYGPAFGRMLSVLDRRLAPQTEIALFGDRDDPACWAMIREAHADLERARVVVGSGGDGTARGPLFDGRGRDDGRATAFVCRNFTCRLPVTDADALRSELGQLT